VSIIAWNYIFIILHFVYNILQFYFIFIDFLILVLIVEGEWLLKKNIFFFLALYFLTQINEILTLIDWLWIWFKCFGLFFRNLEYNTKYILYFYYVLYESNYVLNNKDIMFINITLRHRSPFYFLKQNSDLVYYLPCNSTKYNFKICELLCSYM